MSKPTFPCDANANRGRLTRLWAAETIRLYRQAKDAANRTQSPAFATPRENQPVMQHLTPSLLTDSERGAGESTNARLHRLIGKYRDFALELDKH